MITITAPDGQRVVIRVIGIDGGQVRLGFDAPRSFRILRDNAVVKKEKD